MMMVYVYGEDSDLIPTIEMIVICDFEKEYDTTTIRNDRHFRFKKR